MSATEAKLEVLSEQRAALSTAAEDSEKEKSALISKLSLTEKKLAEIESGAGANKSELTQVQQHLQEELQEEQDRHLETKLVYRLNY